jgi:DCC1-like thiol-disulfide oxidoreductase
MTPVPLETDRFGEPPNSVYAARMPLMVYATTKSQAQACSASEPNLIVLFDGLCNLCCAAVDFIIAHDRRERIHRPIQAKARLLVDRGWSGRFRAQGRLPVYFEASRPASATRIGRDRVPERLESFRAEPLARAFTLRGVSQRF